MVLTMTLRYLIVFGTCIGIVIEANDQEPWNCATAQKCALTLEQNFNESVSQENDSYVIDFCLKKIKDFQTTCLYDAVVRCGWNGNENEYYRLRNVQKKFQDKCSEFCPVMEEIQSCARIVDYGSFIDKKIQSFCLTYKESVSCKNKALSGSKQCSFGEKLFNQDFDEDTLRVFKYICNSECEDLYSAWTVLERCTSTHNLNNTGINCRTYHDLELCISNQSTCPQIHLMVSYFARSYEEHMVKCPLPLPNLPIMDETTMESRSQHHSTTDSKLSKDTSTLNQVLTEDFEKPLTTKDTSMSSNTGVKEKHVESTTISYENECLLKGRLDDIESEVCKIVQCLNQQGIAPEDLPSMGIEGSLEQTLVGLWISCVDNEEPNRPAPSTTHDVNAIETKLTKLTSKETDFIISSDNMSDSTVHNVENITQTTLFPVTFSKSKAFSTKAISVDIVEDPSIAEPSRQAPSTVYDVKTMEESLTNSTAKETLVVQDKMSEPRDSNVHIVVETITRTTFSPTTFTASKAFSTQTSFDIMEDPAEDESKESVIQFNLQTEISSTNDRTDRIAAKSHSRIITFISPNARSTSTLVSYGWSDVTTSPLEKQDISPITEQSKYVGNGTSGQKVTFLFAFIFLMVPRALVI